MYEHAEDTVGGRAGVVQLKKHSHDGQPMQARTLPIAPTLACNVQSNEESGRLGNEPTRQAGNYLVTLPYSPFKLFTISTLLPRPALHRVAVTP